MQLYITTVCTRKGTEFTLLTSAMNSVFLFLTALTTVQLTHSVSPNDTQCIKNPTGEVSLNVAVRGVPGPEGPRGPKGDIGPIGKKGVRGNRGVQGEKGDRGVKGEKGDLGDNGPFGPKGMKGETGKKGQKGALGIQGIPGPAGLPGLEGTDGPRGYPGPDGARGPRGPAGLSGPRGPQGKPGDTVLNEEEFDRVTNNVHNSVLTNINTTVTTLYKKVEELNNSVLQEVKSGDEGILNSVMTELKVINETLSLLKYQLSVTKCGIFGNWRRIAYFDTTQGDSCPTGLRTVTNTTTNQTACGRTVNKACTPLTFTTHGTYSNVCGRVRGYQFWHMDCFLESKRRSLNETYIDGVSFTQGDPPRHLWTYAVGETEQTSQSDCCPCAWSDPNDRQYVPDYIGEHFYCESGFVTSYEQRFVWEDPLWDGSGCVNPGNQCCNRYGWFHCNVALSSDDIKVRWCSDGQFVDEDIVTDQLEIWVM